MGNGTLFNTVKGELKTSSLYKIEKVYSDYKEMSQDQEIEAASIVTLNDSIMKLPWKC